MARIRLNGLMGTTETCLAPSCRWQRFRLTCQVPAMGEWVGEGGSQEEGQGQEMGPMVEIRPQHFAGKILEIMD